MVAMTIVASAQTRNDDPLEHTVNPGSNGQCWKVTDKDRGMGYWGNCPQHAAATTPAVGRRARHSRAQATGPIAQEKR